MLLIWFLTSMPLGLSMAEISGLTWMIKHRGLAVFPWWVGCGVLCAGCAGWVGNLWWAFAATPAQVGWVGVGIGFLLGGGPWGCVISGSMLLVVHSSSTILLVKYALVSTRLLMVCLSMLSFLVALVMFIMYLAQLAASSLSHIRVPLADASSSSISSSLNLM